MNNLENIEIGNNHSYYRINKSPLYNFRIHVVLFLIAIVAGILVIDELFLRIFYTE